MKPHQRRGAHHVQHHVSICDPLPKLEDGLDAGVECYCPGVLEGIEILIWANTEPVVGSAALETIKLLNQPHGAIELWVCVVVCVQRGEERDFV